MGKEWNWGKGQSFQISSLGRIDILSSHMFS